MKFKKTLFFLVVFLLSSCLFSSILAAPNSTKLTYSANVNEKGWLSEVSEGQIAGTTGQSRAIKAIIVKGNSIPSDSSVEYQVYTKSGWSGYKQLGQTAGNENQSVPVQAVQMRLNGSMANTYDIYYRVHSANIGWLDWAANDQIAGCTVINNQAEALEIRLVQKGAKAPGSVTAPGITQEFVTTKNIVSYSGHIKNQGWTSESSNGNEAGTTGQHKALEGVRASLKGYPAGSGGIQYQTFNTDSGWTGWYRDNNAAGLPGKQRPVEILQVELYGAPAQIFDVYYQVHSEDAGWLGWAKNGEYAGTTNGDRQVEAFRIALVPKGGAAPGSTENKLVDMPVKVPAIRQQNPTGRATIYVSIEDQKVYYYNDNGALVFKSICTTGTPNGIDNTPTGNYTILSKQRNVVLRGPDYETLVSFWIPFIGRTYGFHDSNWRSEYGPGVYLTNGSSGCINMPYQNIATLFNIIQPGTPVIIR